MPRPKGEFQRDVFPVRIKEETRQEIKKRAFNEGKSYGEVIEEAIEETKKEKQ